MTTVSTTDRLIRVLPGETLLEALERTGHDVEYQCRGGYCGSCRLTLVEGEVVYTQEPLAFVGPNEVVPCCCVVKTPIKVECSLRQVETSADDKSQLALDL